MSDTERADLIADLLRRCGPMWSKAISRALGIPWEDVAITMPRHPNRFVALGHTWDEVINQTCWALASERGA